ncbi:MAG: hypothetical protein COB30_013115 [Ectothiorhodospiraceae bacterium]|nr:hypothetical protein [Ectothiorhodospiraceae bacterium]
MDIPQLEINEWMDTLKVYQRTSLEVLIKNNSEEEAAKLWLSANGASITKQFGGNSNSEPFWDRFLSEFNDFVCGDEKYSKEREQLTSQAPIANTLFVGVISGSIGATLGFAASLLAPAVAILLFLIGKVGINAYCKNE